MTDTDFETMYAEWWKNHDELCAPPSPDEVRAWWHENHRPPLAERIAEAAIVQFESWSAGDNMSRRYRVVVEGDGRERLIAAVQRVLDDEGERA